ncbi:MAG: hypothetical protein Q8R96_20710 [Bacteroidota bacterium]|nr:hypothetical protein [Bacteroidota bacterium]
MKQHTSPIIIKGNFVQPLEKVSLMSNSYDESWIQNLCFQNPNLLPIDEIEPTFSGMIPICRELSTESGYIDLIYVNESGFITIGECKLWRNPEARRKVLGQVLDYAKDLSKWDYSKFEIECIKSRKGEQNSLFEILHEFYPEIEESTFIDNVQNNLNKGRFLLTIIGDGIRENMEDLINYIHRNGNLNFTIALIEIPIYRNPSGDELIVTPRILAKTKEIERIVYRFSDDQTEVILSEKQESSSKSISEIVFYERLEKAIGKEKTIQFQEFLVKLNKELNIITKLGRGKKLSLSLKSPNDRYNFASIQENGEVWFYGIVNKTEEIGDKQIGIDYLKKLAIIINATINTNYKEWHWGVKRNDKYISLKEYLDFQDEWSKLISDTLESINIVEENQD